MWLYRIYLMGFFHGHAYLRDYFRTCKDTVDAATSSYLGFTIDELVEPSRSSRWIYCTYEGSR
jgi:hypothetical protein